MNTVKTRAGAVLTDKDKKPDSPSKMTRRTSTPSGDKKEDPKDKPLRQKTDSPARMTRRTSTPSGDKKEEPKDKQLRKTGSPTKSRRISTPVGDKDKPDKKDDPKEKILKVDEPTAPTNGTDSVKRHTVPIILLNDQLISNHGTPTVAHHGAPTVAHHGEPTVAHHGAPTVAHHGAPIVAQHGAPIVSNTPTVAPITHHGAPTVNVAPIVNDAPIVVDDDESIDTNDNEPIEIDYDEPVPKMNGNSDRSLPVIAEEVIDDNIDNDDIYPELRYDECSDDDEARETDLVADIRSSTRRSQVQVTRTPETPRPGSDSQEKKENGDDKGADAKLSKDKDEEANSMATGRKLRSADRVVEKENGDHDEGADGRRETNFSKSRVKVSPYRRAANHDSSTTANYTGNNTTMEMDITAESSIISENNSSVRGRKSYKSLKPVNFERPSSSVVTVVNTSGKRLCGAVVGRKRKPDSPELPALVPDHVPEDLDTPEVPEVKRQRRHLLDRVFSPFVAVSSTPEPRRKNAQIVGINSDLPLASPLVTADPEVIKLQPEVDVMPVEIAQEAKPGKRCVIM